MRKVSQTWRSVEYRGAEFGFWSPKIKGRGDSSLANDSSMESWAKIILLSPTGKPDTMFSIGFSDVFGNTKISSAKRKVKDGPFGMRMGPQDCEFFVASAEDSIGLAFMKYVSIEDRAMQKVALY